MAVKRGTKRPISAEDKKDLAALGQRIREIREKKKLTVYDVTGDDLPIRSRQHWQKIELGQFNLTFVTFMKIAESLDVQPSELLKGVR